MAQRISKTQMQTILDGRPDGVSMDDVINDFVNDGYIVEGVNEPKKNLMDKLGDRVSNVKNAISDASQVESPTNIEDFSKGATKMINAGASIPGQVFGAVGDVVGAGLEATGLDEPIAAALAPIVNSAPVQAGIQAYGSLPQETQDLVGNVTNIAGGLSGLKAGQVGIKAATPGVKGALNGTGNGIKAAVKKITPESTEIMQRVARIPKGEQVKFEKVAGESVGSFLDRTGNYGTPEQIIERLYKDFVQSKSNADEALGTLQGTYRATPVRTALSELEGKVQRTSSPGAPDPELSRVSELVNKEKRIGLTMSEINEVKRIYERRVRLDYLKSNVPEDVSRATNVDAALRDWQMTEAEKAGLTNLREINKSTQINKQLLDALGKENSGSAGNNALGLTDAILVAGGSPESIASLITKKIFSDKGVQSYVAKKLSKNKVKAGVPDAQFKEKLQLPAPKDGALSSSNNVAIKLSSKSTSALDKELVSKFGKSYEQVADDVKSFWDKFANENGANGSVIKLDAKNKKVLTKFLNKQPDDTMLSLQLKKAQLKEMYDVMYESGIEKYNSIIKYVEGGAKSKNKVLPEMGVTSGKNSNNRYLNKNGNPLKFQKRGDTFIDELGFKNKEDAQDFIDSFSEIIEQRKLLKTSKRVQQ